MERLRVTNGANRFVGGLKSVASQSVVNLFFRAVRAILTRRKGSRSTDSNFPVSVDRETENDRARREETASVFRSQFCVNRCHVDPVARVICAPTESDKGLFARHLSSPPRTTSLVSFLIIGEGDDYLTVSLRDGGAAVGMSLAKGRLDLHIKPARVRFDDNQWHKIIVHRKVQEVMIMFQLLYRARR